MSKDYNISLIEDFYCGITYANTENVEWIHEIWKFDFLDLESRHDYIQWLFPTKEESKFNGAAPILTDKDIELFQSNPLCMRNLEISVKLMEMFYFSDHETGLPLKFSYYKMEKPSWVTRHNHNFLRITRILKSLTLLGRKDIAEKWLLKYLAPIISCDNFGDWGESALTKEVQWYWKTALDVSI